ncbi:site-specific DNA-methyltransferase [Dinghuibacter silviterrae]|uniref:site-specific DNA-methyltransferase (cytosine-N(4)-specific) n=1 Tax=Dinghuibacter silviterrae TaxID=1539049 RepID=A0A4V3GKK7_9BACT|nr:site-specific DNA-methyltransferase [Dinghuibacter silviterrae]TDW95942.1 DNA methylase [Dinghuibacter silviterrae]
MIELKDVTTGFQSPEARWARFGPYYAMFPLDFAFEVVSKYSKRGDFIIDPFAGRCSSVYAGGVLGRHSLGIEINPVGWLYGTVKLSPADKECVIERLYQIYSRRNFYNRSVSKMPIFYRMCYSNEVLKFLLAARSLLKWQTDSVDATLMSIILVYLHGKLGEGLSNQMRMTKSMGMEYSVRWWLENGFKSAPEINPVEFIKKKIEWRYEKGKPCIFDSEIVFGDSTIELRKIVERSKETGIKFSLLFTSPPYCSLTDYYADQWLRLWLLGGPERPKAIGEKHKGRFVSKEDYYNLLDSVFGSCSKIMDNESTIYVRTDRREFTFESTMGVLKKHFPEYRYKLVDNPFKRRTQTELHGNSSKEGGEIDIILSKKRGNMI